MQASQRVAQADTSAHGGAARFGVEVAHAAHGLGHDGEAGTVTVRTCLPVSADAQHDQAGIAAAELVIAQAPFLHGAGLEVLDQHVGLVDQLAHRIAAFGRAQIEHHTLLVAALHLPPHAEAVVQHAPLAQRVATALPRGIRRRLDLDHLGAEIGQGLAGEGAGDQLAEFEDFEAGQRAGCRCCRIRHGGQKGMAWADGDCRAIHHRHAPAICPGVRTRFARKSPQCAVRPWNSPSTSSSCW